LAVPLQRGMTPRRGGRVQGTVVRDMVGKMLHRESRNNEKRCWKDQEGKNGIRNQGLEQLCQGSKWVFNKTVRQIFRLEIMK
jgi:hypothetical protein